MGSTANAPHTTLDEQERFLAAHGWNNAVRSSLPGDFSARYYVRLADAGRKALLMVMPKASELTPFLSMQAALAAGGMRVPVVHASDSEHGLAIVEDLGECDFTAMLQKKMPPTELYSIAVDALSHLHAAPLPEHDHLPRFNVQLFLEQAGLFLENYQTYVIKTPFTPAARAAFITAWYPVLEYACAIPSSVMLRDYHAANIMYLEHETGHRKAAAIDFQDGGIGPISYDLASLLEDARLDVSPALRTQMLDRYLSASSFKNGPAFMTSYHILAVQRHLRILGILAKRWTAGGHPITEEYFKRVWALVALHQSEPALAPVYQWLDNYVPQSMRGGWRPHG